MKKVSVFLVTVALLCSGFSNEGTWVIDSKSKLAIHGSTNLNTFTCQVLSYSGHDTLHYFKNYRSYELQFTTNRMNVPIRNFDCGLKQISKDFWYTLKSDSYPYLYIYFISIRSTTIKNDTVVMGTIDISLAGETVRYTVPFTMNVKNEIIQLSGTQRVGFTEFKLKAPEKLEGLIRVKEILNVEFHLVLKAV